MVVHRIPKIEQTNPTVVKSKAMIMNARNAFKYAEKKQQFIKNQFCVSAI